MNHAVCYTLYAPRQQLTKLVYQIVCYIVLISQLKVYILDISFM